MTITSIHVQPVGDWMHPADFALSKRPPVISPKGTITHMEMSSVPGVLKTNRILVQPLQPVACKRCWGRRAVNSVTLGPSGVAVPYCQPCTNDVITNHSMRLELSDKIIWLRKKGVPEFLITEVYLRTMRRLRR